MSQTATTTLLNDVARRFKNISERKDPINHISNKVYENAQNTSFYTNTYQYMPANSGNNTEKSAQKIDQRQPGEQTETQGRSQQTSMLSTITDKAKQGGKSEVRNKY